MEIKNNKITQINNFRINFSSYKNIFNVGDNIFSNILNNIKLIGVNNFNLEIANYKLKYSLFYTNPYVLDNNIIKKVKFDKTTNSRISKLCEKIFISNNIDNLNNTDNFYLINIIKNTIKYKKYIGIEESFLVLWCLIHKNIYIVDKMIYFNIIKYNYSNFLSGKFDIMEVILNIIKKDNQIEIIKLYICLYILLEEFHFKYITNWIIINSINCSNKIFSSNYIKLNPQEILSNCKGQFIFESIDLMEQFEIPNGHNILFIFNTSNVFYYDPDQINLGDLYKFKLLFNKTKYNLFNISNRIPIQTITNDTKCIFYCLGLIKYLLDCNIKIFNLSNLKLSVLKYETLILKKNMFKWIEDLL